MKVKKIKRKTSALLTLVLTGGLIAGTIMTGFAANTVGDGSTDAQLSITKNLLIPAGVTQPAANFEFEYTVDGIVTGSSAYNSSLQADSTQPDLTVLDSSNDVSFAAAATKSGTVQNKDVYVAETANIIPAASSFAHAGEYVYTITETADTNSSIDSSMSYSKAEYKLHVFVKNTDNGLVVAGAAVYQTKNDAGETGTNAKVDLDTNSLVSGSGSDFAFTNTYAPEGQKLSISKTVSGDYADMTKEFSIAITMNKPATSEETQYTAVIVDSSSMKPVSNSSESFTSGTANTISLKSGEKLVFVKSDTSISTATAITDSDMQCLPAGTKYSLVEAAVTDYTPNATVTHGGTADAMITGSAGSSFTVNTNTIVDTGVNSTALLSEYHDIAVTGLIIRVLPIVLLIALAIAAILFSMKLSREKNQHNQ